MHEAIGKIKTADDVSISYTHYINDHENVIVVAHGFFNSRKGRLIQSLAKMLISEFDVMLMDFRGHGDSDGLFTWTAKEYLDMQAILSFVRPRYKKVGVIGFSLGGATSLLTASRCELVDSIVCVSSPTQISKIEYHFWDLNFENDVLYNLIRDGKIGKGVRPGAFWLRKDKPIDAVSQIKIPVHYVHGDSDWIIRSWHSQELFEQTKSYKKIQLLTNGPHAEYLIRKNKEDLSHLTKNWFKETLG